MFGTKKKLLAENQELKNEIENLLLQVEQLINKNDELQEALAKERFLVQRSESKIASLKKEKEVLTQKIDYYKSIPIDTNVELYIKNIRVNHKKQLLEKNTEIERYINAINSAQGQVELFKLEAAKLQTENSRLKDEFNKKYRKLAKLQSNSTMKFERNERYYVLFQQKDKTIKYKLAADIVVLSVFSHSFDSSTGEIKTQNKPCFLLSRVYWNNGGHISFEETLPRLYFDKQIVVRSDKSEFYNITLTQDKVEFTNAEINQLKAHSLKIKRLKEEVFSDMDKLLNDRENRFPYFSNLLADYKSYINLKYAKEIINKKNPAISSAEKIKKLSKEIRNLERKYRLLTYQMEIYESEFPWIIDFKDIPVEEIEQLKKSYEDSDSELSSLKEYISAKEYNSLSDVERYQLALDRYKKKHKSNWQIGISFERYVGYLYEKEGYHVTFFGAQKGLDDLGRDLIATRNNETLVIQCKYWNQHKIVHEKHIFQLFGSMFSYDVIKGSPKQTNYFNNIFSNNIKGVFITTCPLSETARQFAERLNIEVKENFTFDKSYPLIKCNISTKTGEKIFHLPFDQQYDNVCIEFSKGEFYAETVQEAYNKGFRRAYRWKPNK